MRRLDCAGRKEEDGKASRLHAEVLAGAAGRALAGEGPAGKAGEARTRSPGACARYGAGECNAGQSREVTEGVGGLCARV